MQESVLIQEPSDQSNLSESESDHLDVEDESVQPVVSGEQQHSVITSDRRETVDLPVTTGEKIPKRQRKKPERYGFANICTSYSRDDDITYAEAISGPEKQQWLQAVAEELQSFADNKVWEVVDAPDNASIVQCKWVLKKKFDHDNKVRFRARLVAKGFTQKAGVDYQDTFSPVIRHSTLRLLLAMSVQLDMNVTHLDVTTAFLNGYLKETVFMHPPEGFPVACVNKVLKLKKAVYGLKQSSLAWYQRVEETLCNLGYSKSKLEPCVFIKNHNNGQKTIVGICVDDFLIFSNNNAETDYLIESLNKKLKIKNLGQVKQYLGMRINIDRNSKVTTL